jgi:hypothetical protein
MSFGSAQTNKTLIGTVELRIGMLNEANKLTAMHSVGIVDSVKLESTTDTAELMAGSPQRQVDVAITKSSTTFTATMRETSRRNMNILLSNPDIAPDSASAHVVGSVSTSAALQKGAKTLNTFSDLTGQIRAGDVIGVFPVSTPAEFQLCEVQSVTGASNESTQTTTLSGFTTPTTFTSTAVPLDLTAGTSPKLLVGGKDAEALTFSYRDGEKVTVSAAATEAVTFTYTDTAAAPATGTSVTFLYDVITTTEGVDTVVIKAGTVYFVKTLDAVAGAITVAVSAATSSVAITSTVAILNTPNEETVASPLTANVTPGEVSSTDTTKCGVMTFAVGVEHSLTVDDQFFISSKGLTLKDSADISRTARYKVTAVSGQEVKFLKVVPTGTSPVNVVLDTSNTGKNWVIVSKVFKVSSRSIVRGKDSTDSVYLYSFPTITKMDVARGVFLSYTGAEGEAASIANISSKSNTQEVTLVDGLLTGFEAGEDVSFYVTKRVSGGATSDRPTYYTVQLLRTDRSTGLPVGINIWKAFVTSGLSLSSNATDFASYDLVMKALEPLRTEYLVEGAVLNHVSKRVQQSPVFEIFDVADTATG